MTGISLFDVIGPNMVGPSSSHTAGAVSMALLARKIFLGVGEEQAPPIVKVEFTLYGSFAKTYKGHGTDKALLGGILGFHTDDLRIRESFAEAEKEGLSFSFAVSEEDTGHPNTADMDIWGKDGRHLFVRGISTGGGKVRIVRLNRIDVDIAGEYSTLIISQSDKKGVAAHITKCLSEYDVNIAFMRLFREAKGADAFSVVESDDRIPEEVVKCIRTNRDIRDVFLIQAE